jgi:LytS/YehU family sensor histidine kinase
MGRPMRLQTDVPPALAQLSLLPGALLCLAENAVKHGLPEDDTALLLSVSARREGASLRIALRDNGPGLKAGPSGAVAGGGTGLSNLRERLRLLYGEAASLRLHNAASGCEAVLTLPCEPGI